MKFKKIDNWKISPALDGLLFFAQRMDELLQDWTLDTYKPAALNAPFLCIEAIELINNIESGLIREENLEHVLNELLFTVHNDKIAKSLLDIPIESYVHINTEIKLSTRKLRLEVLAKTLHPFRYLHACFDQTVSQVVRIKKIDLDHSARMLVTTLINMGMSKKIIYQKTNDYFFTNSENEINDPNQIKEFLETIYPYSHNFEVYFKATKFIETISESISSFDIEILPSLPDELAKSKNGKSFTKDKDKDEVYVHVTGIKALDVYSAYEEANNSISMLRDLFTLFHHKEKIRWSDTALITQCCNEDKLIVTNSNHSMKKAFDLHPEKASKQLNNYLKHVSLRDVSFNKFNRVVDLHGICVTSDIIENQLVNIWTSFETLVPSINSGANIQKTIDGMLPFLMSSYITRIIQTFRHDLIIWDKWKTKSILRKVTGFEKSTALHKTLALLCLEENKELRNELYEKLKDFHLLRFRAFSLSETLSSPSKIKNTLDIHEMKLKWQIRRIYRSRNSIVHSGNKPSYIHTLVENGHDYLDQMLFGVMKYTCGEYNTHSLEQSFDLAKVQYDQFVSELSKITTFARDNCLFLCRTNDSNNDITRQAWQPK